MFQTKIKSSNAIQVNDDLDMNGKRAKNASNAEDQQDFTTKDQIEQLVYGFLQTDYGLIGVLDGNNRIFETQSISGYVPGTTRLYLNGVRQFYNDDYLELDEFAIEFTLAPHVGDKITLDYLKNK